MREREREWSISSNQQLQRASWQSTRDTFTDHTHAYI